MIVFFFALNCLIILILVLLIGGAFYQSEKLPDNSPSKYFKQQHKDSERKRVVVFLGDSITHGRIGVDYVEIIKGQLESEQIELINAGINSELAWNNLQRVDEVIQCEPDIVTVLIGTNDANASMNEKTMKSYVRRMKLPRNPDNDWYKECLRSLVMKIKTETSAKIALLSIPTIGEDSSHPAFTKSTEISQIVHDVTEELDVTYLPLHEKMIEFLQDKPVSAKYPYEKYFIGIIKGIINHFLLRKSWDSIARNSGFALHVDYLHLNTDGARMIADLIGKFILSTLTRT